jgi:hypothetical protein
MFSSVKRFHFLIALLITAAGNTVARPRFKVVSVSDNELNVSVRAFVSEHGTGDIPIAFTALPGIRSEAVLTVKDNVLSLNLLAEGWVSETYLKWYRIPRRFFGESEKAATESVVFSCEKPVYRGVSLNDITIQSGIINVPIEYRELGKKTAAQVSLPDVPYRYGVKIEVRESGIYELTTEQLGDLGVPVGTIASRTYRLFERDREIPLHITNAHHQRLLSGDRILFYGEGLRTADGGLKQFSETNVYWLTWGEHVGARVAVVSGARRADATLYGSKDAVTAREYIDTVRFEYDNIMSWLGNIADEPPVEIAGDPEADSLSTDNWYWGNAGITELTRFPFDIPSPAPRGTARLKVALMGLSSIDSITTDHVISIFINGEPAGENNTARWDGQRSFIFQTDTFSTELLEHGENEITLQTSSAFSDRSALNWIEISYLRGYTAYGDRARIKNEHLFYGRTVEYAVEGFTEDNIDLWDVTHYRLFTGLWTEAGTGKQRGRRTVIFQDSVGSATEYHIQTTDLRRTPSAMYVDTVDAGWDNLTGNVEYLVISADSFRTDLEPLLQQHERDGLATAFVSIDKIYNRFSYGIRDPESIRLFLRYLFTSSVNGNGPRYLLLGGDTTHDLDKKNRERNIVPTHLSRMPGWGPGGDDGYFASVSGQDLFPDCAIGRFPAQNREEMRSLVEKTVRYIREPNRGYWRDNMLLLGGGEQEFTRFNNDAVTDVIDGRMSVYRMDADPESRYYKDEFTAPQLIADRCNSGVFMMNFNGHGGGNIWSDNNFFGYNDLTRLHNGEWRGGGRLPAVFSFTCLTGFFESSEYRSLGEEFLRLPRNGAVCFYGASAYTSRNGNIIMNKLLLDELLSGNWKRLGDCLSYCEMSMLVRYDVQYLNLVRQYNLLGDPALPWILTPDTMAIEQTINLKEMTLSVDGNCTPVDKGEALVTFLSGDVVWDKKIVPVHNGAFSHTVALKKGIESATGMIRAYAWNDSLEVRGRQPFVTDTCDVDDVILDPPRPCFDDSVTVSCAITVPDGDTVRQVYCLYVLTESTGENVPLTGKTMIQGDNDRWSTDGRIFLPFDGSVNRKLHVYFRIITTTRSLQSRRFIFSITGRPDLSFAGNRTAIIWSGDSLRLSVELHNNGTAPAPPVPVVFNWGPVDQPDGTFAEVTTSETLPPGKFAEVSTAMSDTAGMLVYHVICNPEGTIQEELYQNNTISGRTRIVYKDMTGTGSRLSADSLLITPTEKPEKPYRLFLIEDSINTAQPLPTVSRWVGRNREGEATSWQVVTRPSPGDQDSLEWIWKEGGGNLSVPFDSTFRRRLFMMYDSVYSLWRFVGGTAYSIDERREPFTTRTSASGRFAIADVVDKREPEAIVSVYGKTLEKLDYTAKDQPFTLLLSDPSGILPKSVALYLNGDKLDGARHSVVPTSGDLRSMTLSVYPDAQRRVDSLSVKCSDFAGNTADRTFAYLPGKDLAIQSFTCHPNPFTAHIRGDGTIQTIRFAFLLTDIAHTVTLSIFTVSGKKIRTWTLNERIGYQQIPWNGRDHEGYRIANGTYYAKLIVKNDRRKDHKIIRIAKLEGF